MRPFQICFRDSILAVLALFGLAAGLHAAIPSRVVGFVAVEIGQGETKAVGNMFESFGLGGLPDTLAEQLDTDDDIHVWTGWHFDTYTLQAGAWQAPVSAAAMPVGVGALACWVTRNHVGPVAIVVSGYVPERYEAQSSADAWQLIVYSHPSANGHRLNDVDWAGATDGDQLKILTDGEWVDFVYDGGGWTGPASAERILRLGDSMLVRSHADAANAVAIDAPDSESAGGISIAAGVDIADPIELLDISYYAITNDDDGDPDYDGLTNRRERELGADPSRQTLILNTGWNLFAISCVPDVQDTLAEQLGPDFAEIVWSWNGQGFTRLTTASTLTPTNGYWVYCRSEFVIDLPSAPYHDGRRTVTEGWNLVGMIRGGSLPNSIPANAQVWTFEDGANRVADRDRLRSMTGYWLLSNVQGEVVLP